MWLRSRSRRRPCPSTCSPREAPDRLALVLGTEGDGIAARTLSAVDQHVRIPMSGGVDSLNVAAASAVALWALRAARSDGPEEAVESAVAELA